LTTQNFPLETVPPSKFLLYTAQIIAVIGQKHKNFFSQLNPRFFCAHFTKSRIWDFVNYSSKSPLKIALAEKTASERHTKSRIWDFVICPLKTAFQTNFFPSK